MKRRNLFKALAASLPAASVLPHYHAMAATDRKKVKITDVKVMVVRGLFDWPLVRVETDAGIYGIGECYFGPDPKGAILHSQRLSPSLREILIGEDPLDVDRLYTTMIARKVGAGATAGVTVAAISGLEIALWDIAGKILGVPVHKLLGSFRDSVPAYWTKTPRNMLDPASCREFTDMLKSHPYGFKAVKSDYIRRRDIESRLSRRFTRKDIDRNAKGYMNMREALGDDYEIVFHCHWEFDWMDALALARAIAPMRPWWLEDPMPPAFSDTWVKLTEESPVPILMGENVYTRYGFKPFIVNQGCHIIQIDIVKAGGLLEAKKIADLADIFYIPTCAHNVASPIGTIASAHSAASIRNFLGHEFNYGNMKDHLAWEAFAVYDRPFIKDGKYQLSDKPGLGIDVNEDHVRANLAPDEKWWG
ncbi:mandelate racemase/muconate lactonizing enzyme family protein [Candidatus Latescibacterota bacterium]